MKRRRSCLFLVFGDWQKPHETIRDFSSSLVLQVTTLASSAVVRFSDWLFERGDMAGHNDAGTANKKATDDDLPTFNLENLQSNMKTIYYSRTFLSIIGGVIAGIMGFTSLTGFIFYFLVMAITSLALIVKANFNVHSYFDGWNRVLFDGFLSGLMSFVLFWTFAYDIVHIF
uniref:ER membrane protein complex subunit 6 n=1 Tax=Kalanchoe fedtschenkoi TaxID=63787 RepID=A0A7N0UCK2_KALFE